MARPCHLFLAVAMCILMACTVSSAFRTNQRRLNILGEIIGEIDPRNGNITTGVDDIEAEISTFEDLVFFSTRRQFENSDFSENTTIGEGLDDRCPVIISVGNRTAVKEVTNNCDDDAEIEFKINDGSWRSFVFFIGKEGDDDDDDSTTMDVLKMDTFRDLCTDDCCDIEYNLDQGGKYCYHVVVNEDSALDLDSCTKTDDFDFECDDE